MSKNISLHPKAYLKSKRNVQAGLISRSKILQSLEKGRKSIRDTAKETALSYECVAYHLKAMQKDRLVEKTSQTTPHVWQVTPYGQQRLSISN
jgi:predicted transcriptional regulator